MNEQESSSPAADKKALRLTRKSGCNTRERMNSCDLTRAIARRIYESNIKGMEEHSRSRSHLAECIESGSSSSFSSVEFKRARVGVTLYWRLDRLFSSFDHDIESDSAGNRFWQVTSRFEVNWPAIGSVSAAQTLVFADMLKDLGMLCAELEAEFGSEEVWDCVETAEERAKNEEAKAKRMVDEALTKLVQENCKNMRAGGHDRRINDTGLSAGEYLVTVAEKVYDVTVLASGQTYLKRVS